MNGKRKIVVPLSGNLIVLTLGPLIERLRQDASFEVICIDGGVHQICHDVPFPILSPSKTTNASLQAAIARPDLVIAAPTFAAGDVEQRILAEIARHPAPELAYLCDIGGEFVLPKLQRRRGSLPDHILVTDPRTYRSLVLHGVEEGRLVKAGSPLFDRTLGAPETAVGRRPRITYLDSIYELDYAQGRLPCGPYSKERYLQEVSRAATNLGAEFFVRPHPKSGATAFVGFPLDVDPDPDRCVADSRVVVSPYSTMLFQAFLRGLPAISYQPWQTTIRADVFDGRVQIVKSAAELQPAIKRALKGPRRRPIVGSEDETVVYNPGRAAEFITNYVSDLLSRRARPPRSTTLPSGISFSSRRSASAPAPACG